MVERRPLPQRDCRTSLAMTVPKRLGTREENPSLLGQLRERNTKPLIVIWDNSPAHRGDALRTYLTMPGLNLRLANLPSYSPDFNADEAIWDRFR